PRSTSPRSPPRFAIRPRAMMPISSKSSVRRSARIACACCISRGPRRRGVKDRSITISACTHSGVRRSPGSSAWRPRSSNGEKNSSSCARWRPTCASTAWSSTGRRRRSTRPRIWNGCEQNCAVAQRAPVPRTTMSQSNKIVFQGEAGANSHIACRQAYPDHEAVPCPTFEDAFAAVESGEAALGMIPIENSLAGRVADIHHLMPTSGLHIVAEWFLPIRHQLMAPKGAKLEDIRSVESHVMALGQCRNIIRKLGLKTIVAADTAGSAREVAERGDKSRAAIASSLAAEIYGLEILAENNGDEWHNTTLLIA